MTTCHNLTGYIIRGGGGGEQQQQQKREKEEEEEEDNEDDDTVREQRHLIQSWILSEYIALWGQRFLSVLFITISGI